MSEKIRSWVLERMCLFDLRIDGKVKTSCRRELRPVTDYGAANITFPPGQECTCPDCGKAAVPTWSTPDLAVAIVGRWQRRAYREIADGVKHFLFDLSYRDRHKAYQRLATRGHKVVNVREEAKNE